MDSIDGGDWSDYMETGLKAKRYARFFPALYINGQFSDAMLNFSNHILLQNLKQITQLHLPSK